MTPKVGSQVTFKARLQHPNHKGQVGKGGRVSEITLDGRVISVDGNDVEVLADSGTLITVSTADIIKDRGSSRVREPGVLTQIDPTSFKVSEHFQTLLNEGFENAKAREALAVARAKKEKDDATTGSSETIG